MKRLPFVLACVTCLQAGLAAEPPDIFAAPLRLEVQQPAQEPYLPLSTVAVSGSPDRVSIYDRLYLGGSDNLRGFKFRDVGPRDIFGEPVGGSTVARGTSEYIFPIIEKVRGAVFYDTGFVNRGEYDFSTGNLNSDPRIGVRLDLPIGPVRLDYGIPIQYDYVAGEERYSPNLDAPGPGYREQRARFR